jgi:hypothetical protein
MQYSARTYTRAVTQQQQHQQQKKYKEIPRRWSNTFSSLFKECAAQRSGCAEFLLRRELRFKRFSLVETSENACRGVKHTLAISSMRVRQKIPFLISLRKMLPPRVAFIIGEKKTPAFCLPRSIRHGMRRRKNKLLS